MEFLKFERRLKIANSLDIFFVMNISCRKMVVGNKVLRKEGRKERKKQ
tara:strand:+ start:667 stop:810 length:144 start_codon:yes stop_codon:yes gene_type:complete